MSETRSADGTTIAYRTLGSGPPIVLVGGALSTAEAFVPLGTALAGAGFLAVGLDRRGRGGSGDTSPYSPQREVEDLTAVVAAVADDPGEVAVLGHSSGAVLALLAAGSGLAVRHLFLSEPPFGFGVDEPPDDIADRLQALIDDGQPEEAVVVFLKDNVGMPAEVVDAMRTSPPFAAMAAIAQSAVYDTLLVDSVSTPTPEMVGVTVPTTILRGDPTVPGLVEAAEKLAAAMPQAELVVVPESRDHGVDPAGTTREVSARLRS